MFRTLPLALIMLVLLLVMPLSPAAAQDTPAPNPAADVIAALPPDLAIITPDATLVPLVQLDPNIVRAIAANFLVAETPANETWLIHAIQSGIFLSGGGQISFDGTLVAAYQSGRGIMIADTLTNQTVTTVATDLTVTDLTLNATSDLLVISAVDGFLAYDLAGNPLTIPELQTASDFAYSRGGGLGDGVTAVGHSDGSIALYYGAAPPGQLLSVIETGIATPISVKLDRTGAWVVAYDASGIVGVWNVATLEQLPTPASRTGLTGQAFDLLGRALAVASQPGQVDVVDLVSGTLLATLGAGADPVQLVSFSPDGRLLLTYAAGDVVQLWGVDPTAVAQPPPEATLAFDATALPAPVDQPTAEVTAAIEAPQAVIEPTAPPTFTPLPPPACTLTTRGDTNVRAQPTVNSERTGLIAAGQQVAADGQARDGGNVRWYHLVSGDWVRADLVAAGEGCTELPTLQ